ncbi:hypothetical protein ASE01_15915 [Nocardioides sp. Root190]|uniref:hypothetical protein n=1 Tax=Nocardioides sp. Root190 TaxID=1736488 RepID=UPI0006F4B017|nr:hypothetical protein [Nocardioides sp. Root190]KRB76448.1 hypothetical protein ASE01_15915 [Nocardioides sp. Root190]
MHEQEHGCGSAAPAPAATGPGSTSEQLAAWLEGLGLDDHLGAAGLPSFERDGDGAARWRDPSTGKALGEEQLASLDRLLHSEGDESAHAVPLALVQLRRQAQVRAALLASPSHDYAGLATLRGASENATRFAVHKAAERRALLVVQQDGATLVPAFQLDATGELRPELAAVLEPLLASGMDPWQVWTWLTQPAGLLGGGVPHEVARDPEELAIVQHAAVRLAERAR